MNKKLINVFGAAGLSALMAGCSTTGGPTLGVSSEQASPSNGCLDKNAFGALIVGASRSTFNEKCGMRDAAAKMTDSPDASVRVLGLKLLRETSPTIDKVAHDVATGKASGFSETKKSCTVTKVDASTGSLNLAC